jgi:hypothetical protein
VGSAHAPIAHESTSAHDGSMGGLARTRVAVVSAIAIALLVVPAGAAYARASSASQRDSSALVWWLLGFIALTLVGARVLLSPSRLRRRAARLRADRERRKVSARYSRDQMRREVDSLAGSSSSNVST